MKSTLIHKYNAKRSVSLTCATTRLNLYFLSSFKIQSRFSIRNVLRHDLTHLPDDHEPHSSIKSTRTPKYNAKLSEPHSSIKSTRILKYNVKRSVSEVDHFALYLGIRVALMLEWGS
ncbi:uncharacterized protein G2W53_026891 [Senna tora]|uniref:Uncharacterized protein n=1 Tax=Senna tora TaxID=362788 RepID=A0A834WJ78_9FABA|nr:uncharacterized protein G2W53_026891 [Senna tora]